MRNIKWIANLKSEDKFKIQDTTTFDTPQNTIWWRRTLEGSIEKSAADSLYPILQRDYLIWKEKEENQGEQGKVKIFKATPEYLKFKKRQELENKKSIMRKKKNK